MLYSPIARMLPGRGRRVWLQSFSTVARTESHLGLSRKIEVLAKNRGFAWPSSDIYGGLSGSYDYGPLGVVMKENIKQLWWRDFIDKKPEMVRLDSAIILHQGVWRASGHAAQFSDRVSECSACGNRVRVDDDEELLKACSACGKTDTLGDAKDLNLLFDTRFGSSHDTYLRPETAQGIFINYPQLQKVMRSRFPLGVGQIGKAFRNELNSEHFLFRSREFEMMEVEYFCSPTEAHTAMKYWTEFTREWVTGLGLSEEKLRMVRHGPGEGAHYALETWDVEYEFPHGWAELCGIANRGDYDLRQHAEHSNAKESAFERVDEVTGERFVPYVVEPSIGLDRLVYALLCDGYREEAMEGRDGDEATRVKLDLHMDVAPVTVAVVPLSKKEPLLSMARQLLGDLLDSGVRADIDEQGSIGKRYRRQDEIGTHYVLTVDFESDADGSVTIRDGFTCAQVRAPIADVVERLSAPRRGLF